ncbi:MAG TPA: hypothetical protein ENI86_11490 [Acidimicrobiales bacterium]|nr:hypothetical protein [Acidimicrobiales bacterium]
MTGKDSGTEVSGGQDRITREDIENKFRQLTGEVNETAQRMSRMAIAGGAAGVVLLLILAFLIGRSKGVKKTTVVEVVRV